MVWPDLEYLFVVNWLLDELSFFVSVYFVAIDQNGILFGLCILTINFWHSVKHFIVVLWLFSFIHCRFNLSNSLNAIECFAVDSFLIICMHQVTLLKQSKFSCDIFEVRRATFLKNIKNSLEITFSEKHFVFLHHYSGIKNIWSH